MSPQYQRPGTQVPIAVNDVILITTPEGTTHASGCGCGSCSGGAVTGAQGTRGAQGTQGVQGTQGIQGAGTQGAQGSVGPIGPGGGAQGTQGLQGTQGTQGLIGSGTQGVQGVQGTKGDTGSVENLVSRVSYEHTQGSVSDSWTITHNLGFKPNVTVVDSGGTIYEGEISYTDLNTLTVSFSTAFSGKAYLS